jgi:gamma-glutamylcyclotransferase (GGCT)/AIG2-like uncharacterized protein YtfP
MMPDLCFAYGSSADEEAWRGWCARNAVDPGGISPGSAALLPDRCLAFESDPTSRGGVLTVRARIGGYVQGVLFRVASAGRDALEREARASGPYQPVSRTVILPDGAAVAAIVYERAASGPRAVAPPTDDDLRLVRRFLAVHGIDAAPLEFAARCEEGCHVLLDVFAYGTLMQGEVRHAPAVRADLLSVTPAHTRGRLHDLGSYPAMVLDGTAAAREVEGEILTFADAATALPMLDRIEGARPDCVPGGPYRRTIVTVTDASGRARPAWAYVVERVRVASAPIIPSGSWRRRRRA